MLQLFKYEMRKTLVAKLILFGLVLCLEGFFLYGAFADKQDTVTVTTILLIMVAALGVLFIGIQSIVTLHHDMNTKQGYMLFMTPNSNYKILGAKALECTVSVALTGVIFFGLAAADISLIFSRFGQIKELKEFIDSLMDSMKMNWDLDLPNIAAFLFSNMANWIETVMLAFFADVLASSLLKGKKLGGLLAFVLFIVLTAIAEKLVSLIPGVGNHITDWLISGGAALVISVVVYWATATLMEKKLSV